MVVLSPPGGYFYHLEIRLCINDTLELSTDNLK